MQIIFFDDLSKRIKRLESYLLDNGWKINSHQKRLSARKGAIGRIGPPLVHFGLILLIFGATIGVLQGQRIEEFLAPQRSVNLLSPNGNNQINIKLTDFQIDRGPNGQPEQFRSTLELNNPYMNEVNSEEISVNHPLRFRGITIYQADWSLAGITIKINNSTKLQIPLKKLDEINDQTWGVLIPKIDDDFEPLLLTTSSEEGPIRVFSKNGNIIGITRPGGDSLSIGKYNLSINNIIPSSGLLIKYDPGVPLVYIGFGISLLGSVLSVISTKQLWIICDEKKGLLHIGGLSNRNSSGFAKQFPLIIKSAFI